MDGRLPIDSLTRVRERDRKLESRERAVAEQNRRTNRACPCNICLGENHSRRTHATIRYHLEIYGRHPYHRGSTKVRNGFPNYMYFSYFNVLLGIDYAPRECVVSGIRKTCMVFEKCSSPVFWIELIT